MINFTDEQLLYLHSLIQEQEGRLNDELWYLSNTGTPSHIANKIEEKTHHQLTILKQMTKMIGARLQSSADLVTDKAEEVPTEFDKFFQENFWELIA